MTKPTISGYLTAYYCLKKRQVPETIMPKQNTKRLIHTAYLPCGPRKAHKSHAGYPRAERGRRRVQ